MSRPWSCSLPTPPTATAYRIYANYLHLLVCHVYISLSFSSIIACIDQLVTIQSQSRRDSVEREDEDGGGGPEKKRSGGVRGGCVRLSSFYLLTVFYSRRPGNRKIKPEWKLSGPQYTNVWCYSSPHKYLALLRSCRRARQTHITRINSPPVSKAGWHRRQHGHF